jgi:hypothetical protein
MYAGDTVTFNFTYTPTAATVTFGAVSPNGVFWGWTRTSGSSSSPYTLTIPETGNWNIRVRNDSTSTITTSGSFTLTDRRVSLRFLQDLTYRQQMGNFTAAKQNHISKPFENTHKISFKYSVFDINNTILPKCSAGMGLCTHTTNANCVNTTNTDLHHTNAWKNMRDVQDRFGTGGYPITAILASRQTLCGWYNGSHLDNVLGIGAVGSGWSYNSSRPGANNEIGNVRIIQHELSHNYGALDSSASRPCTSGQTCVMNGGFFSTALNLTPASIWCSRCISEFNTNLFR